MVARATEGAVLHALKCIGPRFCTVQEIREVMPLSPATVRRALWELRTAGLVASLGRVNGKPRWLFLEQRLLRHSGTVEPVPIKVIENFEQLAGALFKLAPKDRYWVLKMLMTALERFEQRGSSAETLERL